MIKLVGSALVGSALVFSTNWTLPGKLIDVLELGTVRFTGLALDVPPCSALCGAISSIIARNALGSSHSDGPPGDAGTCTDRCRS